MTDGDLVRGYRISLDPLVTAFKPVLATSDGRPALQPADPNRPTNPTLGEIIDMLTAEYPDRAWRYDPALRKVRVGTVKIHSR